MFFVRWTTSPHCFLAQELLDDPAKYARHTAWKRQDPSAWSPTFRALAASPKAAAFCAACDAAADAATAIGGWPKDDDLDAGGARGDGGGQIQGAAGVGGGGSSGPGDGGDSDDRGGGGGGDRGGGSAAEETLAAAGGSGNVLGHLLLRVDGGGDSGDGGGGGVVEHFVGIPRDWSLTASPGAADPGPGGYASRVCWAVGVDGGKGCAAVEAEIVRLRNELLATERATNGG